MVRRRFGGRRPRRSSGKNIGIATSIGLGVGVAAPVMGIGSGQYNIPYEVQAMASGSKSWSELPNMILQNTKDGIMPIALGIAVPLILKKFIGNRTVAKFGRTTIKAL